MQKMNKIENAIKCVNCKNVLLTHVLLPCNHLICKKHVDELDADVVCIFCQKCGMQHKKRNDFPSIEAFQQIIDSKISEFDFGAEHKQTKSACLDLADVIKRIDDLNNDPNNFTNKEIGDLKRALDLKREELKLKIDEMTAKLMEKLEAYEVECRKEVEASSDNEFKSRSKEINEESERVRVELLERGLEVLDEIKLNEAEWRRIKEESVKAKENLENLLKSFQQKLLLDKFEDMRVDVLCFQSINIDSAFHFRYYYFCLIL